MMHTSGIAVEIDNVVGRGKRRRRLLLDKEGIETLPVARHDVHILKLQPARVGGLYKDARRVGLIWKVQ